MLSCLKLVSAIFVAQNRQFQPERAKRTGFFLIETASQRGIEIESETGSHSDGVRVANPIGSLKLSRVRQGMMAVVRTSSDDGLGEFGIVLRMLGFWKTYACFGCS